MCVTIWNTGSYLGYVVLSKCRGNTNLRNIEYNLLNSKEGKQTIKNKFLTDEEQEENQC